MSSTCCRKPVTSGGINLPAYSALPNALQHHRWERSARWNSCGGRARAWCVGATIHKQALSSEVCSWAGGVGVVADRQRTSSLQPCRRLGDGQAALRHCISLEAEASDAGRGAPRSRAPWPPARSWQVGRRRCVSTLLDLEPVSIE